MIKLFNFESSQQKNGFAKIWIWKFYLYHQNNYVEHSNWLLDC